MKFSHEDLPEQRLTVGSGFGDLGADNLTNVARMIVSWSPIPFKTILRMNVEMYNTLIRGAVQELSRPDLKLYLNVYVASSRALSYLTDDQAGTLHTAAGLRLAVDQPIARWRRLCSRCPPQW